jgi:hypothetical protein
MLAIATMTLSGCQWAAKNLGGDYTVELKEGQKLVNVTWKESELWYFTKPMTEDDVAETYTFQEDSTMGVLEGTVTIVESK